MAIATCSRQERHPFKGVTVVSTPGKGEYKMPVFFIMWAAAIILLGGGLYLATYM
jgi:hypothetical protein